MLTLTGVFSIVTSVTSSVSGRPRPGIGPSCFDARLISSYDKHDTMKIANPPFCPSGHCDLSRVAGKRVESALDWRLLLPRKSTYDIG